MKGDCKCAGVNKVKNRGVKMLRLCTGSRLVLPKVRFQLGLQLLRYRHNYEIDTEILEAKERTNDINENQSAYYPSMTQLAQKNNGIKSMAIRQFIRDFSGEVDDIPGKHVVVNGRIRSIRFSGKKICFINLADVDLNDLQIIVNYSLIKGDQETFIKHLHKLKVSDYIQCVGFPGFSKSRLHTLSLKCRCLPTILSPNIKPLPNKLSDSAKVNKNKVVSYQVNGVHNLIIRSEIIRLIRQFLMERGFSEVETPILSSKSNGANAQPFITKSSTDNMMLELRIAPELWLKRLIIAGMDKIFEIGKVFRNESVDSTHNPEFTMLEFYQRYLSMRDLIQLTQDFFKYMLINLDKFYTDKGFPRSKNLSILIESLTRKDWKFNEIEFLPTLSRELNIDLTKIDLANPQALISNIPNLSKLCLCNVESLSSQQILNKLSSTLIESKYCNTMYPTLIYHHPVALSPLAKTNPIDSTVTKRFELFINGHEYVNAYEEENSPLQQFTKFSKQLNEKDKESMAMDTRFVEAMKSGMPPTGGFGLGIDRLCMLLLDVHRIEDVLPFGSLDDVNKQ